MAEEHIVECTGTLKWFNIMTGYGFITTPSLGDLILPAQVIRDANALVPQPGQKMKVKARRGPKGWKATEWLDPINKS